MADDRRYERLCPSGPDRRPSAGSSSWPKILATAGIPADLDARGHLFDDLDAAIAHARRHVDGRGRVREIGAA